MKEQSLSDFPRLQRLPTYIFALVDEFKQQCLAQGHNLLDFGMGNPDQPTPAHITNALIEATKLPEANRYSKTQGILALRQAMADWYERCFAVLLDPEREIITTIGSKDGLAHLALAISAEGDRIIVPDPAYPIHAFGYIIAGATVDPIPYLSAEDFLRRLKDSLSTAPCKAMVLNFPANPSTACVDEGFFREIIALAQHYRVWVIHDLAYADLCFDGYQAPSILQVPGAKACAVETYTLSKSYNMPGWRVGFVAGNPLLIAALSRLKSYLDYGMFAPIQHAAIAALSGPQECVQEIRQLYQERRDYLCAGLANLGWSVTRPQATMFVWAKIPKPYRHMGSLAFTEWLINKAHVAVSPGIGFGKSGDDYVRFSLIQPPAIMQQGLQQLAQTLSLSSAAKLAATG